MKVTRDGQTIRGILQRMLSREVVKDAEIAESLGWLGSRYSRRKEEEGFPSFENLEAIGQHFNLSPRVLQIAFGYRDEVEVQLLDDEEMDQYVRMGYGNHPILTASRKEVKGQVKGEVRRPSSPRHDAPPL